MLGLPRHLLFSVPLLCCSFAIASQAQSVSQATLPDSPDLLIANSSSQSAQPSQGNHSQATLTPDPSAQDGQQTKRILGVIPNFRAVSANTKLPPQSVKEKFITASQDSFDYSSLVLPAVLSGYSLGVNSVPEFHQGAAGFGRYYWHAFVDQTIENYAVEFVVPVIAHEDTRYYTLGSGGFRKRVTYSLERAVITRSDSGRSTFNAGEVIGSGAAAGISNLYYPRSQRTFGNTAQKWGLNIGIDAGTFVFKEFWPDINNALFHGKQ
jgi:hypothetical protein